MPLRSPFGPAESDGRAKGGLFIWLSGADREVLAKVPRERNKFTALGGVVLMTATMAAASFTFAMIIGVRAPIPVAVMIGLLWGLAIMNLDRWLVTATPRREHWYQNLAATLPRVVLALIMGLVISTPVVLWVFQREIKAGINTIQAENRKAFEVKLAGTDAQIKADEDRIATLQATADGGDAVEVSRVEAAEQLARERVAIREHAGVIVDAQSQVVRANIDDWMRTKLRLEPRGGTSSDDTTYEVIQ